MLKHAHKEADENVLKIFILYIFNKNKEQDLLIISVEKNSIVQ